MKGGAPHSSTRRALLTDESLQHTNNTRSLRRTISSVSLHNSRIMNVRGPKKRITLEGQRRNTEQKVNTGISMAKHGTSGDATLKLEPEKEKGKPVDAILEKRKTRDQSENTVLFKELGNTIGEPQTGDVAEASSTASLAVASLKPSVHTTPGNKGSMDDHTKVPSHQVKQTLDSPESKLSQSIAKGGGRGINISDDLDLEFDLLSHTRDVTYSPQDVNLVIRAPETAITIWDGRVDEYYTFPCQLFLKCMDAEKFCFSSVPDVDNIELSCSAVPLSGKYKPKVPRGLRTSYWGSTVENDADGGIQVRHKEGIHVERKWHPLKDSDGKWGWSMNIWTPIPISVFDKVESRFFKLEGEVWIGCKPVEKAELTFSISVLLRKEYMV